MKKFKGNGKKHPVIIIVDNDDGATKIKKRIKQQLGVDIDSKLFYNFIENLYIMFIPEDDNKAIEDLFDVETLSTKVVGKVFNRQKVIDDKKEYGKIVFAERVIKTNQKNINFNNFKIVFNKFKMIVEDYTKKVRVE